jgi:hypothetical protein
MSRSPLPAPISIFTCARSTFTDQGFHWCGRISIPPPQFAEPPLHSRPSPEQLQLQSQPSEVTTFSRYERSLATRADWPRHYAGGVIERRRGSGEPMEAGDGYLTAGGDHLGMMRAADADRDRVAELLNTAYVEGRLTKDEYDARLESALSARTYADLDRVVIDLPRAPGLVPAGTSPVIPVPTTNGLAMASHVCGLGQFVVGPLTTIPAIALGHMARRQIRRTGQQGAILALVGLLLGWFAVILGVAAVAGLAVFAGTHGMPAHGTVRPGPP